MKFGCRDMSSTSFVEGSSTGNGSHDVTHKRETYKHRATKIQSVVVAKRKAMKITQVVKQQVEHSFGSYVFIGNLEGSVTSQDLEVLFANCGRILRTTLRVSRGRAIQVGVAVPAAVRTPRDRKYASMEFYDAGSAGKALKLHGKTLHGTKIVVSTSPYDLPETTEIAKSHMKTIEVVKEIISVFPLFRKLAKLKQWNIIDSILRKPRLGRNPTERDFSEAGNDKFRFWGMSFPKSLF